MKILGLIPARGGSKGVPKKNIKLLNGKPLLQYTLEVAMNSQRLDKVIVSSDDDEIINVSKALGAEIPFIRPAFLADDASSTLSVVQHAIRFFKEKGENYDAVCLLQVTNPFRNVLFLDNAIDKFKEEEPDSLFSVSRIPHAYNPHWAFLKNDEGDLKIATGEKEIITRRQDLPVSYFRNGSIYITKADVILNDNSLYGEKISFVESSEETAINIDTIEDWKKAEEFLFKRK